MSNSKDYDFSKLYRNRLEKRLVEYLEVCSKLYSEQDIEASILAQMALVGKSIEGIALMLAEQGYVANDGHFVRFTPSDILKIQTALGQALKMRADVMMQPMGLESLTNAMEKLGKQQPISGASVGDTNTGLGELPPLVAVDSPRGEEHIEQPIGEVKDNESKVMTPVSLPLKTLS